MQVATAVLSRNWSFVAGYLTGRFGVDVSAEQVAEWFGEWNKKHRGQLGIFAGHVWPGSTWMMFFKNRMKDAGLLPGVETCGIGCLPDFRCVGVLHVGAVTVLSTEEQLARLHNESPSRDSQVARSKIATTNQLIAPVDSLAAKVTDNN